MLLFPSKKIKIKRKKDIDACSCPLLEMRHSSQIGGNLKEKPSREKKVSQWTTLVLEQGITVNAHEWHESNYTRE